MTIGKKVGMIWTWWWVECRPKRQKLDTSFSPFWQLIIRYVNFQSHFLRQSLILTSVYKQTMWSVSCPNDKRKVCFNYKRDSLVWHDNAWLTKQKSLSIWMFTDAWLKSFHRTPSPKHMMTFCNRIQNQWVVFGRTR
jgi:hypothetical protein